MRNKIKRMSKSTLLVSALSFVLVTALLVGATLAFLIDVTEARTNNFTLATPDLSARLVEPNWDGITDYVYIDNVLHPVFGYTVAGLPVFCWGLNGQTPVTTPLANPMAGHPRRVSATNRDCYWTGQPLGREAAQDMIPGRVANKNPIVYNTGEIWDIWVAARVTIVYSEDGPGRVAGAMMSDANLAIVNEIVDIAWNTNWVFHGTPPANAATGGFNARQTLLHNAYIPSATALAADNSNLPANGDRTELYGASAPVFTTVTLRQNITNAQMEALEAIGGFTIFVEGYAVQGDAAANFAGFQTWAATGITDAVWASSWPINVANPILPRP